jgi:hypothetical protein
VAIPTFTSVTPSTGDTLGGQEVDIVGTNFRAAVAPYEVPAPERARTVGVTFNGVVAEEVRPISDTLLRVRVPKATFNPNVAISPVLKDPKVSRVTFPAVDIVITNLDDAGFAIAGETVTAPASYIYVQPLLRHPAGDSPLLQVFREFLQLLKLAVVMRVAHQTHTDFGEEGEEISALSEHPSIGVALAWLQDPEYSYFDNEAILVPVVGDKWVNFEISRTVMMVATLTISARHASVILHMVTKMFDVLMGSPFLTVPPDPAWPGLSTPSVNRYPLEPVLWPEQIGSITRTNVQAYRMSLRVRGIPILRGDPAGFVHQITNIELGTSALEDGIVVSNAV